MERCKYMWLFRHWYHKRIKVQILSIAVGVLLTVVLGFMAVIYLLLVIGLWCPRNDYDK